MINCSIWCFWSFYHFLCSHAPANKCHKQKWCVLFFALIKLGARVLTCVCAMAYIKWRRLLKKKKKKRKNKWLKSSSSVKITHTYTHTHTHIHTHTHPTGGELEILLVGNFVLLGVNCTRNLSRLLWCSN